MENNDIADVPLFYTDDELEEIGERIRAYTSEGEDVLLESLKNRVDNDLTKACKITAVIALDARKQQGNDILFESYIKYPPFMFYTDTETSNTMLRIYGLDVVRCRCDEADDHTHVHARTLCALMMMNNVGSRPLDECRHVKQWSHSQRERLSSGLYREPAVFLEWDGFVRIADSVDHRGQ